MTPTANQGAAALTRFRELAEHADAQGDALLRRYKAEGDDVAAGATAGQLRWLRSRRELVLDGELLPGGQHSFSLTRMFADFEHGADGDAFQRACAALQQFWYDGLGMPGWDWQAGPPPGWQARKAGCRATT